MATNILMPALSPTMTEGTLARWLKKEGENVKAGDVIAEIETDKATMEVEAVDEGVVEALLVPEGTEEVKVNTPIARLKGEGEEASPVGGGGLGSGGGKPPEPEAKAPTATAKPAEANKPAEAESTPPSAAPSPPAAARSTPALAGRSSSRPVRTIASTTSPRT